MAPSVEVFWEHGEEKAIHCVCERYSHAGDGAFT